MASLKLLAGKSSGTAPVEIFWKYPSGLEVPGPSAPPSPFLGIYLAACYAFTDTKT